MKLAYKYETRFRARRSAVSGWIVTDMKPGFDEARRRTVARFYPSSGKAEAGTHADVDTGMTLDDIAATVSDNLAAYEAYIKSAI